MTCHQGGAQGARDRWWTESGVKRPEDSLTGQSYRHGGGWWDGPRGALPYIVDEPEHWIFADTGLRTGDTFGGGAAPFHQQPNAGTALIDAPILDRTIRTAAAAMTDEFTCGSASRVAEAGMECPPRVAEAGPGCAPGLAEAGPGYAPGSAEAGPGCAPGLAEVGRQNGPQKRRAVHDEQQQFGCAATPLAGYECDGAPISIDEQNRAVLHRDAHRCGTPHGLRVLAHCLLDERWQERPAREPVLADSPHCATISMYSRGGTVFAAGTTDWARLLATGSDAVTIITTNVLERLQAGECIEASAGAATSDRE